MILGMHSNKNTSIEGDADAKTTHDAISRDIKKYNLNAVQIFTHNPRTGSPIAMIPEKIANLSQDIRVLVHGPYTLSRIFTISETEIKEKLRILEAQFKMAQKINARGIVFHIGKSTVQNTVAALKIILPLAEQYGVEIIVESIACKPVENKTYQSTDMINQVTEQLQTHKFNRFWSWCIDTAHIWSMGIDVKNKSDFAKWLGTIKFPEKVSTFHLNGSSAKFNSGKDKHEIPFGPTDIIWNGIKPENSGVAALVDFAIKYNCITILEVNRGSSNDLKKSVEAIFALEKTKKGGEEKEPTSSVAPANEKTTNFASLDKEIAEKNVSDTIPTASNENCECCDSDFEDPE